MQLGLSRAYVSVAVAGLVSLAAGCSPPGTGIDDCGDGIDNDGDGLIDSGDPGCRLNGQSEEPDPVACNDGIDNDNDGLIDFGEDPGCLAGTDEDEYNELRPECSDSIDNDGDGLTDYPFDPGCFLALEGSEEDECPAGPGCPQCANGVDDDGDGLIDFGEDPGCEHAGDADEFDLNVNACGGDLSVRLLTDGNQAVGNVVVGGQSALESPVCGGGGYEYAYAVRIREPTTLLISTDFFQTTVDTVIYFRKDCLDPSTEMGCNDNRAADAVSSELLIDVDEPGVYYLIVDVANLGVTGGFKVGVSYYSHRGEPCDVANPTCAPGDSCRPLDNTTTETTCLPPMCIDEHDNDGDGLADFPWDPGCTDAGDATEEDDCPGGPGCPECGNGVDDDGDGVVDYPADTGCHGAGDDVEENCPDESDPLVVLSGVVTTSSTVGATNDFVPTCDASNHTAPDRVFLLPVLGALSSLTADTAGSTFDTILTVRAMDCNAADMACNDDALGSQSRVTLSGVAAGQYYLIVDGFSSSSGSVTLTVRGTIENGQACDPALEASGLLTCGDGYTCVSGTCVPAQCANGSDDDGDGLIDFPADPGCTSGNDNTEMDDCPSGAMCPACSNDLDDDGDGVIDYPLDPGCQAAGDTNEDDCSTETDGVVALTDRVTLATTATATNDFAPSCVTGSTARDMTFRLSAPGNLLSLDANTFGSSFNTVLSLKAPSCASMPDLACNDDSASNIQSQIALSNLSAGDYYFVVDGTGTASGAVSLDVRGVLAAGESCNAAQEASGLLVCQSGFVCGGGICAQALCTNGIDDDGDGNTDYPDDPGCATPSDVDEQDECPTGPSCPQCSNAIDDDGDGLIDYAMDPGCQAAGDALELDECIAGVFITPLSDAGTSGVTPATGPSSFQGTCNGSATSTEVVYAYQLDRILSSITFSTVGSAGDTVTYVRYQMCGDPLAELGCGNVQNGGEAVTVANPGLGSYFVFVDGDFVSGISYVLGVSGTIPGGDACDPASSQFVCEPGFACDAMSLTCVVAVCNNNLDDDGDGATDYPDDPGCTSISDSDEADDCPAGMSCPSCSNAIDDDGDGSIDFPADLGCSAASDGSEANCSQELDPVTTLTMTPVTGTTVGASSDLGQSCGGSSTPEVTFEVYFPGMLSSLTVDTVGSTYDTLLGIRAGSCGGSSIGCNDDFGGNLQSQVVLTNLAAGSYFIHVDGYNSNSGDFTLNVSGIVASGQTCDPAQIAASIVSCAAGTVCTDLGTGFLCQ